MSGAVHRRHWPGNENRPALALHCMMGSAAYWGPIARRLNGRVDLTAFDLPGHGESAPWRIGQEATDYHTGVTRIAASFIDRPMDLIGHSLGATIALRIAVAAPEAIRSLTLIEPVLFAAIPGGDGLEPRLAPLLAEGRDEDAARLFLSVWGTAPFDAMPLPARVAVTRQIRLVGDTNDTLNHDAAHILRDGGLEAIEAPVMLVMGSESPPIIYDIADALAARLPDVGRAHVPGAGHMAPITHPREVAGLIEVNLDRAQ